MKLLSALVLLPVFSILSSVQAGEVHVGMKAVYRVTTPSEVYLQTKEVIADNGDGTFKVIQSDPYEIQTSEESLDSLNWNVPLDNCQALDGAVAGEVTVPAGHFRVCQLSSGPSEVFFGSVPFRVVRWETVIFGMHTISELESFVE